MGIESSLGTQTEEGVAPVNWTRKSRASLTWPEPGSLVFNVDVPKEEVYVERLLSLVLFQ